MQELDTETKLLETRKKSIDDRAYTYARREDRRRITDSIQSRLKGPGLSESTLNQRRNVYRILGFLSAVGILAAVWTGYELSKIDGITTKYWVTVARLTLLSSITLGVSIYAIQWARKIYSEDSRAERDLERYSYDLNRSSWAIETILEAKKENGEIPPETWIEGTCNNLFGMTPHNETDETAMDAFSDMLKLAARIEVGTDGAKFEFNNKGAKNLAKSHDD